MDASIALDADNGVLERFLVVSETHAGAPAVVTEDGEVSYEEFAGRVRRIAGAIHEASGGIAHPKVLINLPQGTDAYAGTFATLMAGGYYTAANVVTPPARQRTVIESFRPDVIVSDAGCMDELALGADVPVIVDVNDLTADELDQPAPAHELAYVVFTSGSTGQPKGVMIPRIALAHYADWAIRAMTITPKDRMSQHPNLAFDLSVLDLYGALCTGASLHPLVSNRDRLLPADFIARRQLTIWDSVPSAIDLMRRSVQVTADRLASLRLLTFCGEPLLAEHLDAIFAARPDVIVHNTYGPSEATVSCTLVELRSETYRNACGASVAIGDAIPGMGLDLVGGETAGEGEIVLSGPQLASGYWNDEVATAAAFVAMDLGGGEKRVYRTGDWALRKDGHVFFAARMDRQVKVHGYRLELGDIDAALRASGVKSACTVLVDGVLHSFVETQDGLDIDALRRDLHDSLPEYAVPAHIHAADTLPTNQNDKVDFKALEKTVSEMN